MKREGIIYCYYLLLSCWIIIIIIIMKREGEILICRRACAPLIQFYCAKLTFNSNLHFFLVLMQSLDKWVPIQSLNKVHSMGSGLSLLIFYQSFIYENTPRPAKPCSLPEHIVHWDPDCWSMFPPPTQSRVSTSSPGSPSSASTPTSPKSEGSVSSVSRCLYCASHHIVLVQCVFFNWYPP